jgi:hypothetical protein
MLRAKLAFACRGLESLVSVEELLETVKVCSLGQITGALYSIGGSYRRNM